MAGDVTIETERLILREFRRDDREKVHEYAVDPEVYHYMPWGPNSEDETSAFVERAIASRHRDPRLHFELAVTLRETGRLIGGSGIRAADESFRAADMGYCLRSDAWGKGLAQLLFRENLGSALPRLPGSFWYVLVAFVATVLWFSVRIIRRFLRPREQAPI